LFNKGENNLDQLKYQLLKLIYQALDSKKLSDSVITELNSFGIENLEDGLEGLNTLLKSFEPKLTKLIKYFERSVQKDKEYKYSCRRRNEINGVELLQKLKGEKLRGLRACKMPVIGNYWEFVTKS